MSSPSALVTTLDHVKEAEQALKKLSHKVSLVVVGEGPETHTGQRISLEKLLAQVPKDFRIDRSSMVHKRKSKDTVRTYVKYVVYRDSH